MEVVGWVALGIAAAVVVAGGYMTIRAIPDARRYVKIRRM
jgi:hypothetical protein